MRKLLFLYAVCLLLVFPVVANATSISVDQKYWLNNSRSTSNGIDARDGWSGLDGDSDGTPDNNGFEISWKITYDGTSLYTYEYTVSGVDDYLSFGLSHLNVEVTNPSSKDQFNMTTAEAVDKRNDNGKYRDDLNSSTIPFVLGDDDNIYAIKWDMHGIFSPNYNYKDIVEFVISFTTDKDPVWGDFYANSYDKNVIVAEAWNLGLGKTPPTAETTDFMHWIARPDGATPTSHAPEPATMLLLGSGLIGIAVSGKKRLKKRNG